MIFSPIRLLTFRPNRALWRSPVLLLSENLFFSFTETTEEISLIVDENSLSLFPPYSLSVTGCGWRALSVTMGSSGYSTHVADSLRFRSADTPTHSREPSYRVVSCYLFARAPSLSWYWCCGQGLTTNRRCEDLNFLREHGEHGLHSCSRSPIE